MRILFGVQGTGNGHLSRCRTIAHALKKWPVDVDYVFSGRPRDKYFDMDIFGDFKCFSGLTFATHHGRLDAAKTFFGVKPLELMRDIKSLPVKDYDLVVSDFEIVTAWAAKLAGAPSVGISHQAAFQHGIPRRGQGPMAKLLMKHYAPVRVALGLHWYHYGFPILPPIIDKIPEKQSQGHILVYLPFEESQEIIDLLLRFTLNPFVCFHPSVEKAYQGADHIRFEPYSRENFKQALSTCEGVISNAGFELASEALSLGKRLLLKPLINQFEQESNAMTLDMLGLAKIMPELDPGCVRTWLSLPSPGKVVFPDVAAAISQWLAGGATASVNQLSEELWRQVIFPDLVQERLSEMDYNMQPSSSTCAEFQK